MYTEIKECLACGGRDLKEYLDLGDTPLANSYTETEEEAFKLDKFPLKVNFCTICTHSQLSISVNSKYLFKNYKYVSGTTNKLRTHFRELVGHILALKPQNNEVLDIGCNDGSLLEEFRFNLFSPQGVDPAENLREITKQKQIPVVTDYWSNELASKLQRKFGTITVLNCLAHNSNPYDFLNGCREALAKDGYLIVEFPYFPSTVKTIDHGQIYHEHQSYFTAQSFNTLVNRIGLRIFDYQFLPEIHGGTIRFILTHDKFSNKIHELINQEKIEHFHRLETYENFAKQVEQNIKELNTMLFFLTNKNVISYGASAKFSTLSNCKFYKPSTKIRYIVDDNSLKQHLFSPGMGLEIKSPEDLKNEQNPVLICSAHNFKDEIKQRLARMGISGKLINYVPSITIEDF